MLKTEQNNYRKYVNLTVCVLAMLQNFVPVSYSGVGLFIRFSCGFSLVTRKQNYHIRNSDVKAASPWVHFIVCMFGQKSVREQLK